MVKTGGKVVYRDSRTFTKQAPATAWGKQRVADLELHGVPKEGAPEMLLHELITKCLADQHNKFGRTKRYVLELLSDCDIGAMEVSAIQSKDVIKHCQMRSDAGTGPATIAHDVSYLRWCLKIAKPIFGIKVDESAVIDAYEVLHNQGLISKSQRRSRRPTTIEIDKLKEGLTERGSSKISDIPFVEILDFSILSCMRIGEVCKILWSDVDCKQKAVTVRDRKDPRKKAGNHMLVPLLGGSWELLTKQPKKDERVFPYNPRSVTAGFQRVRKKLGIEDLRYHDLRREGASRLFEKGYTIDEVAQVTGHRNINTLWQVYTELFPSRLHDKDARAEK